MDPELSRNLIQRVCVGDILRRRANAMPNATALVEKRHDSIFRCTYKALNDKMNQFVYAVRNAGLKKGDRVGLLGLNSTEYVIALFGGAKGGIVAVPINPGLNPADIVYIINHAKIKMLLVDDMLFHLLEEIKSGLPAGVKIIAIPATGQPLPSDTARFADFIGGFPTSEVEDVIIEDRDTFEILYTSGTTAKPKGVVVSHLSVFIASLSTVIEFKLPPRATSTMLLPIFHCAQQTTTAATLHLGGTAVIFRGFDPTQVLDTIEREAIEVISCLPPMYRALLDHPRIETTNLTSVKVCSYAMTPMDQRTLENAIRVFSKAEFMLGTGQTEFFPSTNTFKNAWQLTKKGNYWGESTLTVDTAVMDNNGRLLPPGEVGEIVWRGPAAMTEYLDNPEATAENRQFGWHHSGDIGFFDEDGQLAFVDRKKDIIKTGGENVPSIKVERVILADPRVASVAVVGLPHPRWIECVTAFVVPVKDVDLTEQDILAICAQELGRFEVPKKVFIVNELPTTSTGKLRKNVLRDQHKDIYTKEFGSGGHSA